MAKTASLRAGAIQLLAGGLVGKLSGIARELALAAAYGTSAVTAAFRISQAASLIPSNLFTSDVLGSGFVPLYLRTKRGSEAAAEELYIAVQRLLFGVGVLVAAVVMVAAQPVVDLLAGGLSPSTRALAAQMLQIMAVGMPLYVIGSVCSYLALANGHHRLVSLRSTFQNVAMLAGVGLSVLVQDWTLLAWGFTSAAAAYAAVALTQTHVLGLSPVGSLVGPFRATWTTLRPFLRLIKVFSLLPVVIQVNEISERVVAAQLGETAVAATEFANFVIDTCVTLLAVPVGLAALAAVGREEASEASAKARAVTVVPLTLGIGVPLSVLFWVKADSLAETLYERGAFTAESSSVTAVILQGFAAGLWCQILAYILAKLQSGAMQPRAVVGAAAAGVVTGLCVLLLAIPTGSALFIGLAGSAYGLTSAVVSARFLGVLRQLARGIGSALPGAGLVYLALRATASASAPVDFALGAVVCGAVWLAYCAVIPCFREAMMTVVGRR